jgi:hypothetical protein
MPFDPAPVVKVGQFQKFADALMRGCQVTYPIMNRCVDGRGGACAIGAVFIGLGMTDAKGLNWDLMNHGYTTPLEDAYYDKYGRMIPSDNDSGRFTREQIAARIAAL